MCVCTRVYVYTKHTHTLMHTQTRTHTHTLPYFVSSEHGIGDGALTVDNNACAIGYIYTYSYTFAM